MKLTPKVCLCVIAKDEEDCIAACLQSAAGLVQDIVLVDTGSSDRTVGLAAGFGARTLFFKWNGDFAAARNFGLGEARGEWVLVLDADEVLAPVDPTSFGRLLTAPTVEGYFVTIRSLLGTGADETCDYVVRLFRNKPEYRFTGVIHEQVAGSIKRHAGTGALATSGITIIHNGYLQGKITAKAKRERNIGIINQALTDTPQDPFLLYSLGIEYTQIGDFSKGNELLMAALVRLKGEEGYFRRLIITLGFGLLQTGEQDRLTWLLDKALLMFPSDPDLLLLRGMAAMRAGRWQAAADGLRQALAAEKDLILPLHYVQAILGDALHFAGCCDQAEVAYEAAGRLAPHWPYPRENLLRLQQHSAAGKAGGL